MVVNYRGDLMKFEYTTANDIITYAKEAEGQYLYQIDKNNMFEKSNKKGMVGTIIEESYFDLKTNNRPEPDFADVGIELKSTGILPYKNKKDLRAKERLVLNLINYNNEVDKDFYSSSFWIKNNKLLIFFYSYVRNKDGKPDYPNFEIIKTVLHEFSESDLIIIKKDWEKINRKIIEGKAHELSESDTDYLGACTKGKDSSSMQPQPFSTIKAKQRAYSLKQGYMTSLVQKYIGNKKTITFTTPDQLQDNTIPELIYKYLEPYIGLNTQEIAKKLNVELSTAKNKNQILVSNIFGIKKTNLNDIEEFSKANIKFKTITANMNGSLPESMSFENLDFDDIYHNSWEESILRDNLSSIKWLFIVFQKDENDKHYLRGIKFWTIPNRILDNEIKQLFNEIKELMLFNKTMEVIDGKVINHLPNSLSFNNVCHIRPKGANRIKSMITLPNGEEIPNQCFWFNNSYIKNIVSDILLIK